MEGFNVRKDGEKLFFNVRAVPNAKKNETAGIYNGALKIKVKAPPENNRANEEIRSFVAKKAGIKKNRVALVKGGKSRDKIIAVEGLSLENFIKKMEDADV
ncbi:MAG TPA: DUF167 domain-containing protein [Firmicutes bacterium]|nr:DUF167 domain-containing protein [Bacillota bacterium]